MVLSIDQIEPATPVENRPVLAYFTLSNNSGQATSGYVQGSVAAYKGDVHGCDSGFDISGLQPSKSVHGIVMFTAPRSDLGNILTLTYYVEVKSGGEFPTPEALTQASFGFNVAGRYSFGADIINIHHTAQPPFFGDLLQDDVFVTCSASFGDRLLVERDDIYLGKHGSNPLGQPGGQYVFVPDAIAGPFDSVPLISPDIRYSFMVVDDLNWENDPNGNPTFDLNLDYSSGYVYGLTYDPDDKRDFVVDVEEQSRPHHSYPDPDHPGQSIDNQYSDYGVRFVLRRFRAPEDVLTIKPSFTKMSYGLTKNFTAKPDPTVVLDAIAWIMWKGSFDNMIKKVDNQTSSFTSTAIPDQYGYAVIKALGFAGGALVASGFAVIQLG